MNLALRRSIANLVLLAAAAAAYTIWRFPPGTTSFYPRCPIATYLHLFCPGCGGTRAFAALLHGNLVAALHWNPMVVFLLPFGLTFFAMVWWRAISKPVFAWPVIPDSLLKASIASTLLFTILRNTPLL